MDVTVPRFLLERRKKKKRKKEIHFVYACRIETLVHVDNVNKLISKGRSIRRIDNISRVYTEYLPLSRLCHSARRYVVRSIRIRQGHGSRNRYAVQFNNTSTSAKRSFIHEFAFGYCTTGISFSLHFSFTLDVKPFQHSRMYNNIIT